MVNTKAIIKLTGVFNNSKQKTEKHPIFEYLHESLLEQNTVECRASQSLKQTIDMDWQDKTGCHLGGYCAHLWPKIVANSGVQEQRATACP